MSTGNARSAYLELPCQLSAEHAGRTCLVPECMRPARRRGRKCNACSLRAWRQANREADRAREAKRTFTEEQTRKRNARATVAMAIRRGRLRPQACQTCHAPGLPHHPDPSKKDELLWLCRKHRQFQRGHELRTREAHTHQRVAAKRKADWEALRLRFAAEWPGLTPDIQATLAARAHATPLGRIAPPGSPLAQQALMRAFGAWRGMFS